MKKDWSVKFYRNDEGECPVEDFLNDLSENDRDKIQVWLDVLEDRGINLHRPQADYLRDGIHELRIKLSKGGTRTLYFFCFETTIILTHAFYKRTDKVPENEINRALIYKQDILNRFNKDNITEL
jgi:phage-related protein